MKNSRNDVEILTRFTELKTTTIPASPSKSYSHRAFILASLAETPSKIIEPLEKGDLSVSIDFCHTIGAKITQTTEQQLSVYTIEPASGPTPSESIIDGGNSGTSIRIMAALSLLMKEPFEIYGEFFLRNRPLAPLLDALQDLGVKHEFREADYKNGIRLIPRSPKPGIVQIRGDISSQFITALLITTPLLPPSVKRNSTNIALTTPLRSAGYVDITQEIMAAFGVTLEKQQDEQSGLISYEIPAGQSYKGTDFRIPGDFSSAAFLMVLVAIKLQNYQGQEGMSPPTITFENLNMENHQPDKVIVTLLQEMGATIEIKPNEKEIVFSPSGDLVGQVIDCGPCPDLFPILCILATKSHGKTLITNAAHVRHKETDRIKVMVEQLGRAGVTIVEREEEVEIHGPQPIQGIQVNHYNDHRIAMAMSIGGLCAESGEKMVISQPEVVADSYPRFFEELKQFSAL